MLELIRNDEKQLLLEIEEKKREIERLKASRRHTTTTPCSHPTTPNIPPTTSSSPAILPSVIDRQSLPVPPPVAERSTLVRELGLQHHQDTVPHRFGNAAGVNRNLNETEIFLRPSRLANDGTRGKPLRIVDFVSRARPSEEEKVLSTIRTVD